MNESRDRCGCGHSLASHDNWGSGPCAARDCQCSKYGAPARANDLGLDERPGFDRSKVRLSDERGRAVEEDHG